MINAFDRKIQENIGAHLTGVTIDTLQVNVGNRCNNFCMHCHVNATPDSFEIMSWKTMEHLLKLAKKVKPKLVDITGGAPELNPSLIRFLKALISQGERVQVRTNLTILLEPEMQVIKETYRDLEIKLVASLPCYLEADVDRQRGDGVFNKSIAALRELNEMGYGTNPKLELDLVFNPEYPVLPPNQEELEVKYHQELSENFGVVFNHLITITNMPIGRYIQHLQKESKAHEYLDLLQDAFNPNTANQLMCRYQIHVGWDGTIYDCDFNYALGLHANSNPNLNVQNIDPQEFMTRKIVTGPHCFGCTAGAGSSCGGALE
ncbi:MAG: arsenosugar biosynthesis radical SAM (seleno)protein ArsS [Candidatus Ranarchaeia archaeon]